MNLENIQFQTIEHGTAEYKNAIALRESILRAPFGLSFSEAELLAEIAGRTTSASSSSSGSVGSNSTTNTNLVHPPSTTTMNPK